LICVCLVALGANADDPIETAADSAETLRFYRDTLYVPTTPVPPETMQQETIRNYLPWESTVIETVPPFPLADTGIIEWRKVEVKPKRLNNPTPKYPDKAKHSGIEGHVMIEFIIDTTGDVWEGTARIVSAKPEGVFEEAALEAIYKWKFSPGMMGNKKVRVLWTQPIAFRLR